MVDLKPELREGATILTTWGNDAQIPARMLSVGNAADSIRDALPQGVKAVTDTACTINALPWEQTMEQTKDAAAAAEVILKTATREHVVERFSDAAVGARAMAGSAQAAIDDIRSMRCAAVSVVAIAAVAGAVAVYNQCVATWTGRVRARIESRMLDLLYQDRVLGIGTEARCRTLVAACKHFAHTAQPQPKQGFSRLPAKTILVGACVEDLPELGRIAAADQDFRTLLVGNSHPTYLSLQEANDAAAYYLLEHQARQKTYVFSVFLLVGICDPHISAARISHAVKISPQVAKHGFCIVGFGGDGKRNLHGLQASARVDRASGFTKVAASEVLGVTIG